MNNELKLGDLVCLRKGQTKYTAIRVNDVRTFFELFPGDIGMYMGQFRQLRSLYGNEILTYDIMLFGENKLELANNVLVKAERNNE